MQSVKDKILPQNPGLQEALETNDNKYGMHLLSKAIQDHIPKHRRTEVIGKADDGSYEVRVHGNISRDTLAGDRKSEINIELLTLSSAHISEEEVHKALGITTQAAARDAT